MATTTDNQPSLLPGLGLGAVGAASYKAMRDLQKIERGSLSWLRDVQSMPRTGDLLADTREMSAIYSRGGSRLLKSRIAGAPVPYAAMRIAPVGEALFKRDVPKLRDYAKSLFGRADMPDKYRHLHYKRFFNESPGSLTNYILTHSPAPGLEAKNLNLLTLPHAEASAAIKALESSNPAQHAALIEHLTNKQRYLGGVGMHGGGAVETYVHALMSPMRKLQRGLGAASVGLGAAGLAATMSALANRETHPRLKFASMDPSDPEDLAAVGVGGALGARGLWNMSSPLDIATTWTEVPSHGAGHMMPGRSMHAALKSLDGAPGVPKFNLHNAVRNRHGVVEPHLFGRKLDMLVDTGLGFGSFDDLGGLSNINERFPTIRLPDSAKPHVRLGGYVGYMTDLDKLGVPHEGFRAKIDGPGRAIARMLGLRDSYIGYGPDHAFTPKARGAGYRAINVAPEGFPTFAPAALQALRDTHANRGAMIDELVKNPGFSPSQQQLLQNYRNKKIISVLGSGRGDYTASRALELAREIKRRGLQDEVLVTTILGDLGKANPITKALARYPNVLPFSGRLPQRQYVGLPAISDLIDASTGTSSLYESLASPAKVVVRDSWNPIKNRELDLLSKDRVWSRLAPGASVADRNALAGVLKNIDLDSWNHGNRNILAAQPGVRRVNSAREILDELLTGNADAARGRGMRILTGSEEGVKNLRGTLVDLLKRQRRLKTIRGIGQLGLGAGIAALPFALKDKPLQLAN